jgi:predicted phosphate transport protein (TIGR00153 family)
MLKRIFLPQEYKFYDLMEKASDYTVGAAKLLLKLSQNYQDADPIARELGALEHECDDVAHDIMDRLNKTFITPLDREDIHAMIVRIDDVVDLIEAAANRLTFFRIGQPTEHSINLAKQILRGCEKLNAAVHGMRHPKQYEIVGRDCIAVHEVENAADDILHEALAELFNTEKDPIRVIKWKDIYETMEMVTDRCEDVANVLQNVIVKMT